MTPELNVSARQAMNILTHALAKDLHRKQMQILVFERFGDDAVLWPEISSKLGSKYAPTLYEDHERLVKQIRQLQSAMEIMDRDADDFLREIRRAQSN